MNLLVVPTFADPYYRIRTDLDGQHFVLDFAFNVRDGCWYMDISDVNEVALLQGIKLVCYSILTQRASWNASMPTGQLVVTSNSHDDTPPGLYDLIADTGRCQLVYISSVAAA